MRLFRETPWYIFWLILLGLFGLIVELRRLKARNTPAKLATFRERHKIARKIACSQYSVNKALEYPYGVDLQLTSADFERTRVQVLFHRRHPDYHAIRALRREEQIEFEIMQQALRGLDRAEECAYLRLKPTRG